MTLLIPYTQKGVEFFERILSEAKSVLILPMKDVKGILHYEIELSDTCDVDHFFGVN